MRREGFLFLSGGLGLGQCSRRVVWSVREHSRVYLHARLRCAIGICGKTVWLGVSRSGFAWQVWGICGVSLRAETIVDVRLAWRTCWRNEISAQCSECLSDEII